MKGPQSRACNITQVTQEMQAIVVERGEVLQRSHWVISRSERLQARVDELTAHNVGSAARRCDKDQF